MSVGAISVGLKPILWSGFERKNVPWEAVFLPVSGFPVPDEELPGVRKLWVACRRAFSKEGQVPSDVFLQANHLGKTGSARLGDHAREWFPQIGLGVWPDRDPPALRTHAQFADLGPGEKMGPMIHQVMQIAGDASNKQRALDLMLGLGTGLEIVTPGGPDAFLK